MRQRYLALVLILLAWNISAGEPGYAQESPGSFKAKDIALEKTPPVDPRITVSRLENGLKYYIRENKKPENRAKC